MKKILVSTVLVGAIGLYVAFQSSSTSVTVNPDTTVVHPGGSATAPASGSAPPTKALATRYKDGTYTGDTVDAYYGFVQVQATVQNGALIKVAFLSYTKDREHSLELSNYATPILVQEAIKAQSARVDIVSGATQTSEAFIQSLASALVKAKS